MIFRNLSEKDIFLDVVTKGKHSALSKIAFNIAQRIDADHQAVLRRLWERENGGATGIGRGIAVPHARLDSISKPVASFTRLAAPVYFGSADGNPVDLVFTLLWPRSAVANFLPALAQLCRMLRAPRIREGLRLAQSADEVITILDGDPRAIDWPVPELAGISVSMR
ncbi:PTS sugar transporter subunit IIA (plasmid) [Rhizobium leguminosarum]|uniref:PTS sugar transporter subunit IIA n=1 Tax=Rhizobium leguminosarum TaxID=384 RepID=UPI0010305FB2|nr:PTS sugar transporter subunit IIA [Rhizobium leguminosarum]NKK93910.1 PTS sugar transporter subunit IIA [Rhizobium leguminosarum bv. viciae]TAU86583.1 PTS sugar transporter subunit IIA [Rhizobium leguminosarum]TAU99405.1 PTS sugar transporter subunit IIA [Rhizobium leguminosarum]TAW41443.1 PTS sugar transporter subunit IIA [Rhizobium leguminosarum]TAY26747.1 PTS sugar transporter subunit IIA [Rhizobium leguminosarum]